MARRSSRHVAFLLLGGYDILGAQTDLDDVRTAALERSDALGALYEQHSYIGRRGAELSQDGFFDDGAGNANEALSTGPGIARVLCYGLEGTATGAGFEGWASAVQVNYERLAQREGLTKARARYRTNGPVEHGRILQTYASGISTAPQVDNGASSIGGGAAYLQWNATAGEANIRVRHSPDNITYTDLFTFTKTVANSRGAERLVTTGAIERFLNVEVTTASATGALSVLNYFVGVVRGLTS